MRLDVRPLIAACALLALPLMLLVCAPGRAQSDSPAPALPAAPGAAERAGQGGLTQAHPSLPSAPGMSPLEPYLITWLLPVSGLLTVFAGFYVDRQMRALDARRRTPPGPRR